MAKTRSELAAVLGGMSRVAEGLRKERLAADEQVPDMMQDPEEHVMAGGFEILPEEPESRPNPPARGKYPRLLQTLLDRGLAPGRPAMSIRVPEGEEPLLVVEGLKREGRRVGQEGRLVSATRYEASDGSAAEWRRLWYIESWVHPKKERIVQVLAKEGVAPYTKKPKGAAE